MNIAGGRVFVLREVRRKNRKNWKEECFVRKLLRDCEILFFFSFAFRRHNNDHTLIILNFVFFLTLNTFLSQL